MVTTIASAKIVVTILPVSAYALAGMLKLNEEVPELVAVRPVRALCSPLRYASMLESIEEVRVRPVTELQALSIKLAEAPS